MLSLALQTTPGSSILPVSPWKLQEVEVPRGRVSVHPLLSVQALDTSKTEASHKYLINAKVKGTHRLHYLSQIAQLMGAKAKNWALVSWRSLITFLIHVLFYKLFYKLQDPLSSLLPAHILTNCLKGRESGNFNKVFSHSYCFNSSMANIQDYIIFRYTR